MRTSNARAQNAYSSIRCESRQNVVHLVEYSRYPRQDPGEDRKVAYTQDRSATGLGLDLPEIIEPGELLRISLRDIDGLAGMDGLARVVWCQSGEAGRVRAGLSILRETSERPMVRIRGAKASGISRGHLHEPH